MSRRSSGPDGCFLGVLGLAVGWILLWLAIVATILFAAWHFIAKYW
jgi:hypothetical protein